MIGKFMTAEDRARQMEAQTAATTPVATVEDRVAAAQKLQQNMAATAGGAPLQRGVGSVKLDALRRKRAGGRTLADVIASVAGAPGAPSEMLAPPGKKGELRL